MGHFCTIFYIKFFPTKRSCSCLTFFIFYINLVIVCVALLHDLLAGENKFLKMLPGGKWAISLSLGVMIRTWGEILTGVQTLRVNFAACESISKWPEQKFNKFSQSRWNYKFEGFGRRFNKYSEHWRDSRNTRRCILEVKSCKTKLFIKYMFTIVLILEVEKIFEKQGAAEKGDTDF